MRPFELAAMLRGYFRRLRRHREQAAEHAAWVMIPHLRKPIAPSVLLGDTAEAGDPSGKSVVLSAGSYGSPEEFIAAVQAAATQVGARYGDQRR